MSGNNDARLRQSCIQLQPTAIKQLNHLLTIDSRHVRGWEMSRHTLDLKVFQNVISSRSGDKIHASLK